MAEALQILVDKILDGLKPKKRLSVTEFCRKHRYIPQNVSVAHGMYDPDLAPHMVEIQDLYYDDEVEEVFCKMASQVAKSEGIYNILFDSAINNPGPQLVLYPTKESIKEDVVKIRITPMLESNKILSDKFDMSKRNQTNSIYLKQYEDGYWKFVGCNVPNDLASKSIRDLFVDEHSRIVASSGKEGDPYAIARRRQALYRGSGSAFSYSASSPTMLGECAISTYYETSKRHMRYVPCFFCNEMQLLEWAQVRWENNDPKTAFIECVNCRKAIRDEHKHVMLNKGEWRTLDPDKPRTRMGFHLNALYSSPVFYPLSAMVQNYFDALLDESKMQVFINTDLALEYEGQTEGIESNSLYDRKVVYPCEAPEGVLYVTCGVDVNGSFISIECVGWGLNGQSWSLDYREIQGSPENPETFRLLQNYLMNRTFQHEWGFKISISATFIDSGFEADTVYRFVLANERLLGIYAAKGVSGFDKPVVGKYSKRQSGKYKRKVKLFPIGVDGAKKFVYGCLRVIDENAANFCFYPVNSEVYDKKYFTELTSERLQTVNVRGRVKTSWVASSKIRNEPLDVRVLALAGIRLITPRFEAQKARFEKYRDQIDNLGDSERGSSINELQKTSKEKILDEQMKARRMRRSTKSWVRD